MAESFEDGIHRAVGMSDLASLLAAAFCFPEDGRLADALVDDSFLADWRASWEDACGASGGADETEAAGCGASFARVGWGELRREYSRLFLTPGVDVPVWPYESCFLHRESGAEGTPSLFRTYASLDVERQMAEAGVRPAHARTEPVDSVFLELDFLAHLYARWGETLRLESEGEPAPDGSSEEWASCIASFASDHALKWLPSFMRQVRERSRLAAYRELADLGLFYLEELGKDADVFSAKEEVPA